MFGLRAGRLVGWEVGAEFLCAVGDGSADAVGTRVAVGTGVTVGSGVEVGGCVGLLCLLRLGDASVAVAVGVCVAVWVAVGVCVAVWVVVGV